MATVTLGWLLVGLTGCTASETTTVALAAGTYQAAFDAAREELTVARFPLERIDAARGVIASGAKATAGLASPWDSEARSFDQAWEDLVNEHHRVVRIRFVPIGASFGETEFDRAGLDGVGLNGVGLNGVGLDGVGPDGRDLRVYEGPMVLEVESTILRARRRGYRPETESAGLESRWFDPQATSQGYEPDQLVPLRNDPAWAAELARRIESRLAIVEASTASDGPSNSLRD
ncbi:MAG: hypothetical protein AAF235_06400 [Planctomycetota bacterium]